MSRRADLAAVTTTRLTAPDAEVMAAQLDGALVLVVQTAAGRFRRRSFLTVASAERAAERARAAGHHAEVILCALTPVRLLAGATEQTGRAA